MKLMHRLHSSGLILALIGWLAMMLPSSADAAETYSPDALKAAYLYRFAGYVSWPEAAPSDAPFTIAVLGSPGVAAELERLLPRHPINGQIARVREITTVKESADAKILYVGAGRAEALHALMPEGGRQSTLLVTDEEGGLNNGAAINFLTIDRNVRFEVSLTAADRWGLRISAELLGVALRVQGGRRQTNDACFRQFVSDTPDSNCGNAA
jgi:hypothetical protein